MSGKKEQKRPDKAPVETLKSLEQERQEKVSESSPSPEPAPAPVETPKKRGRPAGSKSRVAPQPDFVMRPMMKSIIMFPYDLAAKRFGEHWKLSDEEAERMIDPHLALVNRYLPDTVKDSQELYGVLLLHGLAIVVRASFKEPEHSKEPSPGAIKVPVQEKPPEPGKPSDLFSMFQGTTRPVPPPVP